MKSKNGFRHQIILPDTATHEVDINQALESGSLKGQIMSVGCRILKFYGSRGSVSEIVSHGCSFSASDALSGLIALTYVFSKCYLVRHDAERPLQSLYSF